VAGKFEWLAEGIWLVGRGGWGGVEPLSKPTDSNVYLVDGGGELALVDTGSGAECPELLANVRAAGFEPGRISKVFLTHAHSDHSAGAAWLRGITGARLYAGPLTARALAEGERYLIGPLQPFERCPVAPLFIDKWLCDCDTIQVGNAKFTALSTPGHSTDSFCYSATVGNLRVLFSGDTAIGNQPRKDIGPAVVLKGLLGWLDGHWSAPLGTYRASLERLLRARIDLMLPGHGASNDAATARSGIEAGIKHLQRILDDPELYVMFAVAR